MSCLFSPFRRRNNNHHQNVMKENMNPNHQNNKNKRISSSSKHGNKHKDSMNTNSLTFTNSNSQTNTLTNTPTHSQSTATKSTVTYNLSGLPYEIGGHSFDACDEISLMSSSTFRYQNSFDQSGGQRQQQPQQQQEDLHDRWLKSKSKNNNQDRKVFFNSNITPTNKKRSLLGARENEETENGDGNDTISHFTRISI